MKKIMCLILAAAIFCPLNVHSLAAQNLTQKQHEQTENEIYRAEPEFLYKTVQLPVQEKSFFHMLLGGQPIGGTRLSSSGSLFYSTSGGTSVSGSITLPLPAPYNILSFSVTPGKKVASGGSGSVPVPNTTDYFLLYVDKVYRITPVAHYRKHVGSTEDWKVYFVDYVKELYTEDYYPEKAN